MAHQKQFVVGPLAVRVGPEWEILQLANGLVLSFCPKLRVSRLRSRDGLEYVLLGLAVLADMPHSTVEQTFASRHSSEIEEWTGFWAGKWALISAERCWQDAAGLLGLYYRRTADAVWISSSPAIVGDYLPNVAPAPRLPWKIAHEKGMDWIPAPLTTRENVFKLLALRTIAPRSGEIRPVRFSATRNKIRDVRVLPSTLQTLMGNWGSMGFRQCAVGLTAGFDTRTVLAAAKAADVRFEAFTDVYPRLARADRELPPRLAGSVGVVHRFHDEPELCADEARARQATIMAHMDRAVFHPTATMCASGRADHMHDAGLTIASGHGFEIGRCAHWARFFRSGLSERMPTPGHLLRSFFHARPNPPSLWIEAMTAWQHSLSDPIPLDLDWRDRFYLEQRFGAWASTVQRTLDVLDGNFFYPANCLWIGHLLLQYSPRERRHGFAQRSAIQVLAPPLTGLPFNPEPVRTRLRKRLRMAYVVTKHTLLMMPNQNPFKPPSGNETASTELTATFLQRPKA
ncbi:hypothetical protein [Dongia deserti]|uniref:hypothetical protein n=1 Tax=Dongia deserti TaxID=2268030 RepID=UPI0013C40C03|nr:hypothetical protein [Dongia deserti]